MIFRGINGSFKLLCRNWRKQKAMGGVENLNITAVEIDPNIAEIYKELYPNDTVIIGDAHKYLRENFRKFDFIWASPPCPTHSVLQMCRTYDEKLKYPDMTLYQEIILLKQFYKGKWVIENVKPYYEPLIQQSFIIDRHYFWSSNFIWNLQNNKDNTYTDIRDNKNSMADAYGFDIETLKKHNVDVRKVLRNCVVPEVGKYIFDSIIKR